MSVRERFSCSSSLKTLYSSSEICPVYPIIEEKTSESVYFLTGSSAMSTPVRTSLFSMIAAAVSVLTPVAMVVTIYFICTQIFDDILCGLIFMFVREIIC